MSNEMGKEKKTKKPLIESLKDDSKVKRRDFYTPQHLVDLLTELFEVNPDERNLDPACGMGGFLVSATKGTQNNDLIDRKRDLDEYVGTWQFVKDEEGNRTFEFIDEVH
jgi:hypothetical protein